MKNATAYQKKITSLLKGMKKAQPGDPPKDQEAVRVLIESVLQTDTTRARAQKALEALENEFVDFNELRVSPDKDIVDCIGRDYPEARSKAEMITTVLRNLYERTYDVALDYMADMTKRRLRRHLGELGLSEYPSACVVSQIFGGHAVPVDETLVEVLKMKGYVHPASDLADVQGFMERVITQKNGLSAHEALRELVEKSAKALAKKRKTEAEARAKAEAEAAQKKKKAKKHVKAKKAAKKTRKKIAKKASKRKAPKATRKVAKTKQKKAAQKKKTKKTGKQKAARKKK